MSHEKFKIGKNKPTDTLIKPCLALDNIDSSKKVDNNLIYLDISQIRYYVWNQFD